MQILAYLTNFSKKLDEDQKRFCLKRRFVVVNLKIARRIETIFKAFCLALFRKKRAELNYKVKKRVLIGREFWDAKQIPAHVLVSKKNSAHVLVSKRISAHVLVNKRWFSV